MGNGTLRSLETDINKNKRQSHHQISDECTEIYMENILTLYFISSIATQKYILQDV